MKNLAIFFLLMTTFLNAQKTIKGTLSPMIESDWVILYKINGAQQKFVKNTTIKIDSLVIEGKKQAVGSFQFDLPADAKTGSYRVSYRLKKAGTLEFFYNQENVTFSFNPDFPEQTVVFSESKENIFYRAYLATLFLVQQKADSIQVKALQENDATQNTAYQNAVKKVDSVYKKHSETSKKLYIHPFVKASLRAYPTEILQTPQEYMTTILDSFFDNMDFTNQTLLESSFLLERISEYIFYLNHDQNLSKQKVKFKQAVSVVFSKLKTDVFKKETAMFLMTRFESNKAFDMVAYIFERYYKTLPKTLQEEKFIEETSKKLNAEVGKIAPDFSWNENGKQLKLHDLKGAAYYVVAFWSTSCPHCLTDIPLLYRFMETKKNAKVIAFALETDAAAWKLKKATLPGWHHVVGLGKWDHEIVGKYQLNYTPAFFILDANKKIIFKPEELKDLKAFFGED